MDFCWAFAPPGSIASPTISAKVPTAFLWFMVLLRYAFHPRSRRSAPLLNFPRAAYRATGFSPFRDRFQPGGESDARRRFTPVSGASFDNRHRGGAHSD